MNNFFIRRRGFMFKLCKRNVERIDKKKKRGDASINSLDRIFKKQNLVRDAFYMIKMSRNQTGRGEVDFSSLEPHKAGSDTLEQDISGDGQAADEADNARNQA